MKAALQVVTETIDEILASAIAEVCKKTARGLSHKVFQFQSAKPIKLYIGLVLVNCLFRVTENCGVQHVSVAFN
jgi:hypothetical protein